MYLSWYDDNPKKTVAQKIVEACAAYKDRFHTAPNVVLVNSADVADVPGLNVHSEGYIQRNNFWIGWEGALS